LTQAVLAAQSPIFNAMFEKITNNTGQPMAYVNGFDNEAFKEVLHYIYTGRIKNLYNHVEEILQIANSFKIIGLKKICEESLYNRVNSPNAYKLFNQDKNNHNQNLKSRRGLMINFNPTAYVRLKTPFTNDFGSIIHFSL
jgi:speckle-type POZ protein